MVYPKSLKFGFLVLSLNSVFFLQIFLAACLAFSYVSYFLLPWGLFSLNIMYIGVYLKVVEIPDFRPLINHSQ